MSIKVGDVVRLKSGGPKMTANAIGSGLVDCYWFTENIIGFQRFSEGALQLLETMENYREFIQNSDWKINQTYAVVQ